MSSTRYLTTEISQAKLLSRIQAEQAVERLTATAGHQYVAAKVQSPHFREAWGIKREDGFFLTPAGLTALLT